MDTDIAFCGLYCIECPAFIAKRDNNQHLREEASKSWSRVGFKFKPEQINCDGCHSDGELLEYCASCKVRNCAIERVVNTCADCNDYPCPDKLVPLWKQLNAPQAKETLDELHQEKMT